MENQLNKLFTIFIFVFIAFAVSTNAQKAVDYKITNLKIVPFEQQTGRFEPEITEADSRAFFNDLGKGLFLTIEISGKSGDYQDKKGVQATVTEGKKIKLKKVYYTGVLGEDGKYYIPVWLEPAMCAEVKITAIVVGQKTPSKITKTLPFMCGE